LAGVGTLLSLATTEFNMHGDAWRTATFDVSQFDVAATAGLIASPASHITTANIAANKVHRIERTFDALSRPLQTTNADGTTTRVEYDAAGRVRKAFDELNRVTEFVYDSTLGRLTSTIAPDPDGAGATYSSPVTTYRYDAAGNRTESTDSRGFTTKFEYDVFNRVATTVDALGGRARGVYNAAGQMVGAVDVLGRSTYTLYDRRGRVELQRAADPDGAGAATAPAERFEYDAAGRVVESIDVRGYSTFFQYDLLGRVTVERYVVSEVIDDGDPGFGPVGGDDIPTKSTDASSYAGDYTTMTPAAGTHTAEAQWLFTDLPAGTYRLAATWKAASDLGTSVQVRVAVDGGALANPGGVAFSYNPGMAPSDIVRYDDGVARGWEEAPASVTITGSGLHQLRVVLTPPNDTPLRVDAVRLERFVVNSLTYEPNGNLVAEKDALGHETAFRYDELNRTVRTYSPDPDGAGALQPLTTHTTYDGYGNVVKTTVGRSA
jgi:YD repeat-containing protein